MTKRFKQSFIALFLNVVVVGVVQASNYTSITFKQTFWSGDSYVGDLSDWVYFDEGQAKVLEYRSLASDFNVTAAIRENEKGQNELESLVGATRIGGMYLKLETGGADGQLFNPDKRDPVIFPEEKTFTTKLNTLALGKPLDVDGSKGVKVGAAIVQLQQPAQIDLTYYTVLASAGVAGAPKWAESAVDPDFSTYIMGFWLEIDSLRSFMEGEGTFYSSPTVSGSFIRGFALDWELVAGLYYSEPSVDYAPIIKEAYGLNYKYVDSSGFAWTTSYKLAYNLVYKPSENWAFGMQLGVEGRALQTILDLNPDETVATRDEVIGKVGIGDNSTYQWGPYFRLAMEF